jgi:hypothetical protein
MSGHASPFDFRVCGAAGCVLSVCADARRSSNTTVGHGNRSTDHPLVRLQPQTAADGMCMWRAGMVGAVSLHNSVCCQPCSWFPLRMLINFPSQCG